MTENISSDVGASRRSPVKWNAVARPGCYVGESNLHRLEMLGEDAPGIGGGHLEERAHPRGEGVATRSLLAYAEISQDTRR